MNEPKLKMMSMAELSFLAKNEYLDMTLREDALVVLRNREARFYQRHVPIGRVSNYYVPNVLSP
jgi:hypothetical protein